MVFSLNINNKMLRRPELPGASKARLFFSGFPTSQSPRLRRSDWEVENDGGGHSMPGYQLSQWMMVDAAGRVAGLKSVPLV